MMKKILILFLLIGITQTTFGQTISLKTSSVSITEKNEKGKWNKWSDFVDAEILITIDAKKDRIVVNSPEIQVLKSYGEKD
jgi:predicted secreted protein